MDSCLAIFGWEDGTGSTPLAVGAAIAIVCIVMLQHWRRWKKTQRESSIIKGRADCASPPEMQKFVQELGELARQISVQAESQVTRLEKLIAEADARIETLRKLGDRTWLSAPSTSLGSKPSLAAIAAGTERSRSLSSVDILVGEGGIRHLGAKPSSLNRLVDPDAETHRRVYQLSDTGCSVVEIARELRKSAGEVELILNLRPRA